MILFSHPLAEVRPSEALHQVDQLSSTIFWRLRISSLCFLCIILCLQEIDLRTQDDGNLSLQIQPLISVVFPSCPDKVPWEECVEAAGVIFYYLPWWVVFASLFCREPQYHVHFHWAVTEQIIHSALKKRSVPCWPVNLDPVSANSKAAIGMDLSNSSWNDVCPMQSQSRNGKIKKKKTLQEGPVRKSYLDYSEGLFHSLCCYSIFHYCLPK